MSGEEEAHVEFDVDEIGNRYSRVRDFVQVHGF